MNEKNVELLNDAVDYAKTQCDQAEFIISSSDSFSLSTFNEEIDKYNINQGNTVGVRVIHDGKVGISYSEQLTKESLQEIVQIAKVNSTFAKNSPHEKIQGSGKLVNNDAHNQQSETTSNEDKIKFGVELEQSIKSKDARIKSSPYNGVSESSSERYSMNTTGLFTFEKSQLTSCYTSCLMEDGEKNGMHYHSSIARNFKDLDSKNCVEESYRRTLQLLEAKPIESGKYDLIFPTDNLAELLGVFGIVFSGKATVDKTNPWKDKMGELVASPLMTIKDIPQYKDAFHRYMFDDEGIEHRELALIENGKLNSFYHNSATASELGLENTGHASRSTKGSLGTGGTNKVILPGTTSESDLTSNPYLEIFAFQGLHSGADAISGDFSFAASGVLHKNGEEVPFKGVTLSGNFNKLINSVAGVGAKVHANSSRGFFAPMIRFEGQSIAGI